MDWLILVAIVVAYIQGRAYKRMALRGVAYSRAFGTKALFEGEEMELIEEISNRKAFPLPWLRIESLMDSGLQFRQAANLSVDRGKSMQNHTSLFSLKPYSKIIRRHQVRVVKRGCYSLRTATMTAGDVLGLFAVHKKLTFEDTSRLLVYPRMVPLEDLQHPFHALMGEMEVRRWIVSDPFVVAGVREYRAGEPLNTVNWKATAKSGRLQVHNRGYTSEQRLWIWLNFDSTEWIWNQITDPELIETGIRYAASLAEYAIANGIPTGFSCNAQHRDFPEEPVRIAPEVGSAHLYRILETMALLEMSRRVTFGSFLEEELERGIGDSDIVVFTAYVNPKLEHVLERLKQRGNGVQTVLLEDLKVEHLDDEWLSGTYRPSLPPEGRLGYGA